MEQNVWVVFEINHIKNYERMSSIHTTEEVANEVAEYYRSKLNDKNEIEYIIQSWVVVESVDTLKNAETINLNEKEETIIS